MTEYKEKKEMKINIIKMSVVTAMLLSSGAYAGKIIGANASDPYIATPLKQFSFGGWNLDDIAVNITDTNYNTIAKTFYPDGTYDVMAAGDSFESEISTDSEIRGRLHGKDWPIGEPSGIKIINADSVKHGKPDNCIMTTSYLSLENNPAGVNGYLDSTTPAPTICSSAFQSHKRFKVNMIETIVAGKNSGEYGNPVDLVFNLDTTDTNLLNVRYQVLQKINNYTGVRLDGYKVEVLDASGSINAALTLSLGLGEDSGADIWTWDSMATFSHGLWGAADGDHFPSDGFFDIVGAGFKVSGHNTNTIVGGPATLGSNYAALFGLWLPSKWQPIGIFHDADNNTETDADLVAFWGTAPGVPVGTAPAWHKGLADNWAEPSSSEFLQWETDPLYSEGEIEDTLNLGLNYIVNVGNILPVGSKFTVRIIPHIAADQTPPSYIDGNGDLIPPTPPSGRISDGTVAISPAPTFVIGDTLILSVKDEDQNTNSAALDTTIVTVTTDTGDKEIVTLTETEVASAIFTSTIPSQLTLGAPIAGDGKMNVVIDSVVTVSYVDNTQIATASTTATILLPDAISDALPLDTSGATASSGGGGCTYNPNSKNFDMTFLLMIALGLLYPFRRRFLT